METHTPFRCVCCEIGPSRNSSWNEQKVCVFHIPYSIGRWACLPFVEAGYKALFLSVDVPVLGHRLNEYRNDFRIPADMSYPNILSSGSDQSSRTDYGSSTRKPSGVRGLTLSRPKP